MSNQEFSIEEGTIIFWVEAEKVNFSDTTLVPLFQKSDTNGNSVFILKDSDSKVKFFHVKIGKGRTDVEIDVSKLLQNEKHMFGFTWSVSKKIIHIYIDGKEVATSNITY